MSEDFHYGDEIRADAAFYDEDLDLEDPTTVTFLLKKPSGSVVPFVYLTDAEVIRDNRGLYHMDFIIDEPEAERWYCRIEGVGIVTGVDEKGFSIKESVFY